MTPITNSLHRALSVEKNMALEAGNYERTLGGIILEIIASILTFGIAYNAIEDYHTHNRESKTADFNTLVPDLIWKLSITDETLQFIYKGLKYTIIQIDNDIHISHENETKIIINKTISEVKENLKFHFISNMNEEDLRKAEYIINDAGPNKAQLSMILLKNFTSITQFDHLNAENIIQYAIDFIKKKKSGSDIEIEINSAWKSAAIDQETNILIKEFIEFPDKHANKLTYPPKGISTDYKINKATQTDDEVKIRKLMAEIIFPENSWVVESHERQKQLKDLLLDNTRLLQRIFINPDLINASGLPKSIETIFKKKLESIPLYSWTPSFIIYEKFIAYRINNFSEIQWQEIVEKIDAVIDTIDLKSITGNNPFANINVTNNNNYGKYLVNVTNNYFNQQQIIDKRAMLSSFLKYSGSEDSDQVKLGAILKAAGPFLQKLIQVSGPRIDEKMGQIVASTKSDLPPINDTIVKARIRGLIDQSNGKISSIHVIRSLGAATVGQTLLANFKWDGRDEPQEVVVKILRPGIKQRAQRELEFLRNEADAIPGIRNTLDGMADQVDEEMDLSNEYRNVQRAQVYNYGEKNVQAMRLINWIPSSDKILLLEKASGHTVETVFTELQNSQDEPRKLAIKSAVLATCIASLCEKWIQEAIFGSGFYHGDLHTGNYMFSMDEQYNGVITIIDMGNAAVLDKNQRSALFKMSLAAALKKPEPFVKSLEKLFSDENLELLRIQRSKFVITTKTIMENSNNPGDIIRKVLNSANSIGLAIPSVIANFSRSQMMLQDSINNINKINTDIFNKLTAEVSKRVNLGEHSSPEEKMRKIKKLIFKLNALDQTQLTDDVKKIKNALEKSVDYYNWCYPNGKFPRIKFSEIILKIIKNQKAESLKLSFGHIMALIPSPGQIFHK